MRRLTSGGYNAPGPVDRNEAARAAAIASMGCRLAAAGPRTRQRLVDREVFQELAHDDRSAEAPQEASVDEASVDIVQLPDHPPIRYVPFHEPAVGDAQPGSPATIRLVLALGTAAACGFGLVLLLQNPHWIAALHGAVATARQTPVQVAQIPEAPVKVVQPPHPEQQAIAAAAPSPGAPGAIGAEPAPPHPRQAALSDDRSDQRIPTVQPAPHEARIRLSPPPELPAPVRQKTTTEYASVSRLHARLASAPKPSEPKPQRETHPVVVAKYEFPRWLTEDHSTEEHPHKAHVLVMSEPPHDLMPPPNATTVPVQAASAAPHPALRRQAIIYAAAGPSNQVPLRPPGYRPFPGAPYPTFYGPYYPPAAESAGRTDVAGETQGRQYPAAPSNGW